jgi:hypothetical protein
MKPLRANKWSPTFIVAGLLLSGTILTMLVSAQNVGQRAVEIKVSELPMDAATNDLARVRIVSGGKIFRVSDLVRRAQETMRLDSGSDKEVERRFLVTVYAEPAKSNLCWIGFSAGFGRKGYHVEFDRSGNIVANKPFISLED